MQNLAVIITVFYLLCSISYSHAEYSSPPTCGCCPSPWCTTKAIPCSANDDCECLLMTMTGGGMCADTVISCSNLTPCQSDNVTCLTPNTVCVNNTRCGHPVCFPIERASSKVCPSMISRYSSTTPSIEITSLAISTLTSSEITASWKMSTTTIPKTTTTTEITTTPETTTTTTTEITTTPEITTITTPETTTTETTTETVTTTTPINPCLNNTACRNGGSCQSAGSTFFCLCPSTFYGTRCENYGSGTYLGTLEGIINGSITSYDKTVENTLNRTNWTNILAVVDVTGSMQPCAAAVYKWMKLAYEKLNLIQYYVFFNDGDNKSQDQKHIGSTGGIYGIGTTNLDTVLATMEAAMRNGNGGDGPENDIEALIFGIHQCPTCDNVILIADNQVTPRDMILLPQVTKPVKVIICQLGSVVNVNLIDIAAKTNGSIHTLQEDIFALADIPVGGTITIGAQRYQRTATGYILLY